MRGTSLRLLQYLLALRVRVDVSAEMTYRPIAFGRSVKSVKRAHWGPIKGYLFFVTCCPFTNMSCSIYLIYEPCHPIPSSDWFPAHARCVRYI